MKAARVPVRSSRLAANVGREDWVVLRVSQPK